MNITLIGMAGVGKSSIGKILAKELGYRFIDVDDLIMEKTGKTIQQLLESNELLKLEEEYVLELKVNNTVISPGGSIVYSEKAMNYLKKISKIIFLKDSLENIQKKIKNKETRGIVGLKEKGLRKVFDEREHLYMKYSDAIIEIKPRFKDSVKDILVTFEK